MTVNGQLDVVSLSACCFCKLYFNFCTRQHICYSTYMPRQFRPSVCLSVTRVLCIKTAERIIEILSLFDRPIILMFLSPRVVTGTSNTRARACDFRPIRGYISETVIDRGIFSTDGIARMESRYLRFDIILDGG